MCSYWKRIEAEGSSGSLTRYLSHLASLNIDNVWAWVTPSVSLGKNIISTNYNLNNYDSKHTRDFIAIINGIHKSSIDVTEDILLTHLKMGIFIPLPGVMWQKMLVVAFFSESIEYLDTTDSLTISSILIHKTKRAT